MKEGIELKIVEGEKRENSGVMMADVSVQKKESEETQKEKENETE